MEIKDKKQIIIGLIILVIIIIGIIIVNSISNKKENNNSYLIAGNTIVFQKIGNNWHQITEITDNILNQKYTVKTNNKTYKNSNVSYASNMWYYMDKDYKDIQNVQVAYTNMNDITPATFQGAWASSADTKTLQTVLNRNDIANFLNNTRLISFDFDQDGTDEVIYTTTNASLSYTGESEKNLIFMIKGGQIQKIEENDSDTYMVMNIMDLDNDNNYEMIVSKGSIDIKTLDTCYQIYKMKDNSWQLIHDCE